MKLTLANAKEYVTGYCEGVGIACDIEGCGLINVDGLPVVRLNVIQGGDAVQWDVWEESDEGRPYLYGEF